MENAGGQVVGLTSDGATTNRTMWNLLGVNNSYSINGLMTIYQNYLCTFNIFIILIY